MECTRLQCKPNQLLKAAVSGGIFTGHGDCAEEQPEHDESETVRKAMFRVTIQWGSGVYLANQPARRVSLG
jgi:hypothetical protein